uniref:ATP synthase F0 subunit 8 n=1 Tax=Timomenus komarovi TaxID=1301248 RepID=UPI0030FEE355|nr:ATP synthase F0 subunit 8 [Timomenus komarovi]
MAPLWWTTIMGEVVLVFIFMAGIFYALIPLYPVKNKSGIDIDNKRSEKQKGGVTNLFNWEW